VHGDELNEELLEHLVIEFGDGKGRAVEFLRTAASLLNLPSDPPPPRHAECVVYCLREALKTIPESYGGLGGGEWKARSRKVSEAKQRFEQIRGLPGADTDGALRELLDRIDDLALTFEQETIHQKRLIAVMVERTGAEFRVELTSYYDRPTASCAAQLSGRPTLIAVGIDDGTVALWDPQAAESVPPAVGHRRRVHPVQPIARPGASTVVLSAAEDGAVWARRRGRAGEGTR
jgi:hypothetical protein